MKTAQIVLFIIFSCSINSCSKKQERSSLFISPLSIEITKILVDDPEIVETISVSEKSINEFSDNIEMIAIEGESLIHKDQDNLTIMEGLTVAKIMLDFYSNNAQLQNTIEEFEDFIDNQKKAGRLNELQSESLTLILLEYKHRSNLLKYKYPTYYKR
ncbi:MAG: hypothetical protein KAG37_02705 [Flavobacteriales bacterium]|nr:hypothetical protein [Flavobacteriales bacterium]